MRRIHDFLAFLAIETDECVEWPYAIGTNGYGQVYFDGKVRDCHRLALIMKVGEQPGMEAAHGGSHGPCVSRRCMNYRHLTWKTRHHNALDRAEHGTENCGSRNGMAKLSEQAVREIREHHQGGWTITSIAVAYGVSRKTISGIVRQKTWRAV